MRLQRSAKTSTSKTQIAVSSSIGGRAVREGWKDAGVPAWRTTPRTSEIVCSDVGALDTLERGDATTDVVIVSSLSSRLTPSVPPGSASRSDMEASLCGSCGGTTSASAGVGTISVSEDVLTSLTVPGVEATSGCAGSGSGRHSRFDRLQRGQTQTLDLRNSYEEVSGGEEKSVQWGYSQRSETLALVCGNLECTDAHRSLTFQREEALESNYSYKMARLSFERRFYRKVGLTGPHAPCGLPQFLVIWRRRE